MIPFLSKYRQQFYYERAYWMSRAEKRKAWLMALGILVCIVITLFLWMR
jgi:hypothetical protein